MWKGNRIVISMIEAFYIIYMWNYFKTSYSFHNIWEDPMINIKQIPAFFKHKINTGIYENKICPMGNTTGYLLAAWILLRENFIYRVKDRKLVISKRKISKLNKIVFIIVAILSFIMNLNAFIYLIPVFIYEIFIQDSNCRRVRFR
jgi:hypothetical protein